MKKRRRESRWSYFRVPSRRRPSFSPPYWGWHGPGRILVAAAAQRPHERYSTLGRYVHHRASGKRRKLFDVVVRQVRLRKTRRDDGLGFGDALRRLDRLLRALADDVGLKRLRRYLLFARETPPRRETFSS